MIKPDEKKFEEEMWRFDKKFPHPENHIVCSCGHTQDKDIAICHNCGKDLYKEAYDLGKKLGLI